MSSEMCVQCKKCGRQCRFSFVESPLADKMPKPICPSHGEGFAYWQPCDPPESEGINTKLRDALDAMTEENDRLKAEVERLQIELDETDKMAGAELARRGGTMFFYINDVDI